MMSKSLFRLVVFAGVFLLVQLTLRDAAYAVAAAFLLGLLWLRQNGWSLVLLSFLAMLAVWAGMAAWIDAQNASILSQRIGKLFGGVTVPGLIAISGTLAGLWAALGTWAGWAVGRLFFKKDTGT